MFGGSRKFVLLLTSSSRTKFVSHLHSSSINFNASLKPKSFKYVRELNTMFAVGVGFIGVGSIFKVCLVDTENVDEKTCLSEAVQSYIRRTYCYFNAGLGMVGITTYLASCIVRRRGIPLLTWSAFSVMATVATSILCQSLPYDASGVMDTKHLAWLMHTVAVGCTMAPLPLIAPALAMQCAAYTVGGSLGLTLVVVSTPHNKFTEWVNMGGLCCGGVVGSTVAPVGNSLPGLRLWTLCGIYAGLMVFGGLLCYNVGKIVDRAEMRVENGQRFDPINNAIGVYMDLIHPRFCGNNY